MDIQQLMTMMEGNPEKARNDALLQFGLATLANNTSRNPMKALAAGGMAGMQGYNQSMQSQQMDALKKIQMQSMLQGLLKQQQQEQALQGMDVPPEVKSGLIPYAEYWKKQNPELKPQLVEIADPKEPLRTVKQWVVPGQTQGVTVGAGTMPEILDPRVQAAKTAIAKAGAANQTVKLPAMETEENKAVGKELGETYTNFVKAGMQAPSKIAQLQRMNTLLEGVSGGKLSPAGLEIASALNSMGVKVDPKLGNKEAAEALSREIAGSFRQPGTGPMTDKDFDNFLKRVPDLSKTAEGRAQISQTMMAALQRDIEVSKMAREYRAKNKTLNGFDTVLADYYAQNPVVSISQDMPPAGAVRRIR